MTTQNPNNLSPNNEPIGFISGGGLEANLQVRLPCQRKPCKAAPLW